jgi:hypothetical protein
MLASTLYVEIVLAFSGPAFGEDGAGPDVSNPVDVNAVFGRYGFSITPHVTGSSCSVTMTLAEKTFVDSIPELKQIGLLNNELTQTAINSKPNMISMAFVIETLPVATREVYDSNKNVDICEFSQSLLAVDDYGNDKKIPMLTYEFSSLSTRRSIGTNSSTKPNEDRTEIPFRSRVCTGAVEGG